MKQKYREMSPMKPAPLGVPRSRGVKIRQWKRWKREKLKGLMK